MSRKEIKETWKNIKGYEDIYQVSDRGRIRSISRIVERKSGGDYFLKGRILSMDKVNKSGYRFCCLSKNDKKDYRRFNRLVAEAFIPNPDNKPFVNHIDGDKLNDNVENLEWCTNKENIIHAVNIGDIGVGEDSPIAKLSNEEVRDIFKLAKNKVYKQKEISIMYGITQSLVSGILHGRERSRETEDLRKDDV